MNNELLLLTGSDIPFPEARITVHNPKMKEIGFIGEENFHPGVQFLNFSKDSFSFEGKSDLDGKNDFDIFMSIMLAKEKASFKFGAKMVLALLFPEVRINFSEKGIEFLELDNDKIRGIIDRHNYDTFKNILTDMFCLDGGGESKYNPQDGLAAKIAEKFKKRDAKLAKQSSGNGKTAIYSRYISILAVGEHKDLNSFNEYTVYQLNDEFKRFQKKTSYDIYVQAKMAGARDLEEVDNWMNDIHN